MSFLERIIAIFICACLLWWVVRELRSGGSPR